MITRILLRRLEVISVFFAPKTLFALLLEPLRPIFELNLPIRPSSKSFPSRFVSQSLCLNLRLEIQVSLHVYDRLAT